MDQAKSARIARDSVKDTDSTLKIFKIAEEDVLSLPNINTTGAEKKFASFENDVVKGIVVEANSTKAKPIVVKVNNTEVVLADLANTVLSENDVVEVVVTAEDETKTTTYKITVKKEVVKDTDSTLKIFKIAEEDVLSLPNINTTGAEKKFASFENDVVKGIVVEANSTKAKPIVVKVNNTEVVLADLANTVLSENDVVEVVVTAEDETKTTTYKITVVKNN
ncbi:hypothetical protein KQI42_03105 [Tissierella sp. MSJ-40]|uniref:Cadherin-like beta sandwich domain-containing protein n=1 Tax=Tissierella simiarum TaxID=2841534 RepID=A0ABS6E248_9FIRM|nr:hypothetical protein [Tissierella simiarum]MBU5436981.1 hypothetical protein [Tissierella simiarum]